MHVVVNEITSAVHPLYTKLAPDIERYHLSQYRNITHRRDYDHPILFTRKERATQRFCDDLENRHLNSLRDELDPLV